MTLTVKRGSSDIPTLYERCLMRSSIYNLVEYTVYMLFLLLVLFLDYLKQKIKGVIQQTPEMKK